MQTGQKRKENVFIFQMFSPHDSILSFWTTILFKKSCEFYISPYLHDLRKNGKVGNAWDVKVN